MLKKKSITQRAAEAIKSNASSAELLAIKREVSERIQEVDSSLKAKQVEIEDAMGSGDLELLRAIRQSETDLDDEDKMLHRQQSELHRAIGIAQGQEAVKATSRHRKDLDKALEQAQRATSMLEESQRVAHEIIQARHSAANIGQSIAFSANTIRALATTLYPEGNQRSEFMLNLGIREAIK